MLRIILSALCLAAMVRGAGAQDAPPEAPPQPLACVPPPRARELLFEQKLVPPFRIMRQGAAVVGAEPIDIALCWFHAALVYDVTFLTRDGRVVHRLFGAASGQPLGDRPKPPDPRKAEP